jgi:hypothetical protein
MLGGYRHLPMVRRSLMATIPRRTMKAMQRMGLREIRIGHGDLRNT